MRHVVLSLLLLCSCSSLSSDDQKQLASHQQNAAYYYEKDKLDQAMGQIEKGLALDPDDYKLNAMKGKILLKTSGSSLGQDHRRLDEATAILEKVYQTRDAERHEPYLLFDYALALQKQGRRHLGNAMSLRDQASRAVEKQPLLDKADAAQTLASGNLHEAQRLLGVLVARGELLRLCHYHLLLIAEDLKAPSKEFDAQAELYFKQLQKDQRTTESEIKRTQVPGWELAQIEALKELRQEEVGVRALLAEHYTGRKEFAKALEMLDRVLELDPSRSNDYYNRGRVLLDLKRDADASKDFRRFLASSTLPDDSPMKVFALTQLKQ